MGIKSNALPAVENFSKGNDFIVNGPAGTGRMTGDAAAEFMKEYFLAGGVPYGKELNESWASLQARIQSGDFTGIHIGDFKTIQLSTGETVVMEVAGIDQYYKCGDATIGHHIDFISRDCLAGGKQYNTENNNNGTEVEPNPWRASLLFQTMNGEGGVVTTLPADLQACIIEKRALLEQRYSSAGPLTAASGWAWYDMGKLWLPTEVEVFGHATWSEPGYGTGGGGCNLQYPIFTGGAKHIIKGDGHGGARCAWWGASASRLNSTNFCYVGGGGLAYGGVASYTGLRVPLCFRIG